ncbi:MAG: hypothetical protein WD942_03745, partial [Dehalococcoidia bacterium]
VQTGDSSGSPVRNLRGPPLTERGYDMPTTNAPTAPPTIRRQPGPRGSTRAVERASAKPNGQLTHM